MNYRQWKHAVVRCLSESEDNRKFSAERFLTKWYGGEASVYYVLFRKNLRVTNMQFAELFALLRRYSAGYPGSSSVASALTIGTKDRFARSLQLLVDSFAPAANRYSKIVELYGDLIRRTILVHPMFGSCVIHVPQPMTVDLRSICAHSGYIHSCGDLIYLSPINVSKTEDLESALTQHLGSATEKQQRKVFFAVYAHEDFTRYDRKVAGTLRDGLDDVKIFVEKLYIGRERLVTVLRRLRQNFASQLVIPEPGDYRTAHEHNGDDIDQHRTIWMISDRHLGPAPQVPGVERSLVCYNQMFANRNPFLSFDENMPAWRAHTTIPHTLSAAMINITTPWLPRDRPIVLSDPFAGTGTIALEAAKFNGFRTRSSDIDVIFPLLAEDNFRFFSQTAEELKKLRKMLENVLKEQFNAPAIFLSPNDPVPSDIGEDLSYTIERFKQMHAILRIPIERRNGTRSENIRFAESDVMRLRSKHFDVRLMFYIALRTLSRHAASFERDGNRDFFAAYRKEAHDLLLQLDELIELREMPVHSRNSGQPDRILTLKGKYSLAVTVDPNALAGTKKTISRRRVQDARKLAPHSCNLIITDPPYGFNTDEDTVALATLYAEVIPTMIKALRDDGQLVLCLMDRSFIGRVAPFFTAKDIVAQHVVESAKSLGYETIPLAGLVPDPSQQFAAPYYWESERALRRAILYFRFRRCRRARD